MNRVVEDTLRAFVNHRQTNWDELLPLCQFAINNSFQTSTGESPFFLNSGQHPITPIYTCRLQDKGCLCQHRQHTAQLASTSRRGPQIGQGRFDSCASLSSILQWQGQDGDALGGGMIWFWFIVISSLRRKQGPSDKLRPRWCGRSHLHLYWVDYDSAL